MLSIDSSVFNPEEDDRGGDVELEQPASVKAFAEKLQSALKQATARLLLRSRPEKYNTFNLSKRRLDEIELTNERKTKKLRSDGFPSLARWLSKPAVAATKETEVIVISDDSDDGEFEAGAAGVEWADASENGGVAGLDPMEAELEPGAAEAGFSEHDDTVTAVGSPDWGMYNQDHSPRARHWQSPSPDNVPNPEQSAARTDPSETPDDRIGETRASPLSTLAESVGAGAAEPELSGQASTSAAPMPSHVASSRPSRVADDDDVESVTDAKAAAEAEDRRRKHSRRPPSDPELIKKKISSLEHILTDKDIDLLFRGRLTVMVGFLRIYEGGQGWTEASLLAAEMIAGKGAWLAHEIRRWTLDFMENDDDLPVNRYGEWNVSRIDDEDLAAELELHLMSKGLYVTAQDLVDYMAQDEVKFRYGLTNGISRETAMRWMSERLGFRYGVPKRGLYIDGHEREDVVEYRQNVFLPMWKDLERKMVLYDREGNVARWPQLASFPTDVRVILLTHDESTFYANDRRKTRWQHINEKLLPMKKGQGASIMISDFCSPDLGWLRSLDG